MPASTGRRWVIDPIDGTKNFVRNVPVWATLIALLDGDDPVRRRGVGTGAGPAVVGAPRRRRVDVVAAADRRGAIAVSKVARLGDASLSYASLGGWADRGRRDAFVALTDTGVAHSRAYGDFWSYMLVAEGAVDLAAEPELSLWDMAALAPIVTEAGGRFTGLDGVDGVHRATPPRPTACCTRHSWP